MFNVSSKPFNPKSVWSFEKFKQQNFFSTEELCVDYLLSFVGSDVACSKCNSKNFFKRKNSSRFAQCSQCSNTFSLLSGTVFKNTKVPIQKILYISYLLIFGVNKKKNCVAKELEISYKTCSRLYLIILDNISYIRSAYRSNKNLQLKKNSDHKNVVR